MVTIGANEAKTHLPQLLDRVAAGEEITITRRGVPVAKLVPTAIPSREDARQAIAEIERVSKTCTLNGLSIREMIEEGRRY